MKKEMTMARAESSEQQTRVDGIIRRSIFLPLFPLLLTALVLFWQLRGAAETTEWVDHTDRAIAGVSDIERMMLDRESSLRGFLITGMPAFLEQFDQADAKLGGAFDELDILVSDNPPQQHRLHDARELGRRWGELARDERDHGKGNGLDERESSAVQRNKLIMDKVRAELRAYWMRATRI